MSEMKDYNELMNYLAKMPSFEQRLDYLVTQVNVGFKNETPKRVFNR
jgi:hypothetical protein